MQILLSVSDILRDLWASLCQTIYQLIAWLYDLFINISRVEILSQDDIKPVYQRVTMILAIIMVFYVTFELVKYIVEPDTITDKEKGAGNVVKKMIIVVVLIAFVPTMFSMAYKIQNRLINGQVFSKVILGKQDVDLATYGRSFSSTLFGMFYYVDDNMWGDDANSMKCDGIKCKAIVNINLSQLAEKGNLTFIHYGLNETEDVKVGDASKETEEYMITFDGLLAVGVGLLVCYMLILYCIDAGTRVAQLAFLQLIAPVPIIGYLGPKKDGIFQKWYKQCFVTYLDLFIRLTIIYVILLLCQILAQAYHSGTLLNNIGEVSRTTKVFMYVFIVMGLLAFANRAPKMLKELFPSTSAAAGSLGLKPGDRVAPLAARAIGGGLALGRTAVGHAIRNHAWRKARNKANGWATGWRALTKEGRETNRRKREEEKQHRQELRKNRRHRNALNNSKDAKQQHEAAGKAWREKVEKDQKIQDARKRMTDAHQKEKEALARGDTAAAQQARKEAQQAAKEMQTRYKELEGSKEKQDWNKAREEFRKTDLAKEMKEQNRQHNSRVAEANIMKKDADQQLADAMASGDPARIAEAQQRQQKADAALKQAEQERKDNIDKNKEQIQGDYDSQDKELETKIKQQEEQVLEDKNKHYQGVVGSAFSTIGASISAAATGAKATKWEDIGKQVKQAVSNDKAQIKAVQKYYDDGGTGWVDRTIQQVEKSIGVPTAYERTMLEAKAYEPEIKKLEAQAGLTKDVKATADSADDRLQEKIGDLKIPAEQDTIKTGLTMIGPDGKPMLDDKGKPIPEYADVKAGDTLADVYRRYEGRATTAQAESEQAAKALEDFNAANAVKLSQDPATLTGDAAEEYKALKKQQEALEKNKEEKGTAAK